jgi:type I restriction enzyme M protein
VISQEGLAALESETAWERLTTDSKDLWLKLLDREMGATHDWHWMATWLRKNSGAMISQRTVPAALIKAFQKAFGVRDPEIDPICDKNGDVIPDDDLTDFENIPLGTDIQDYMAQEVLPHAHDAYVDETFRDEYDGQVGVKAEKRRASSLGMSLPSRYWFLPSQSLAKARMISAASMQ